jgi:hypothetical protein
MDAICFAGTACLREVRFFPIDWRFRFRTRCFLESSRPYWTASTRFTSGTSCLMMRSMPFFMVIWDIGHPRQAP